MRFLRPVFVVALCASGGLLVACGADKENTCGGKASCSPVGAGGSAAASGAGGTSGTSGTGGGSGTSGSGGSGNGGSGGSGGSGIGGSGFGGGGPGCDGTKVPSENACVIHEDYGVFVSLKGSDATGNGTREKPFATIQAGVNEATAKNKRVYVCSTGGTFIETISLNAYNDGVTVHGGFDCTTWNYNGTKTKLTSSSKGVLEIEDMVEGTLIEDFEMTASGATSSGQPSVGARIANSQNVLIRRVKISAGTGTAGLNGTTTTAPAANGKPGKAGVGQCSAINFGGAAVSSGCTSSLDSIGGEGGVGALGTLAAGNGYPGEPALGGGAGGKGATNTPTTAPCANGGNGAAGADGLDAAGGKTPGLLSSNGWFASTGEEGGVGGKGQGGGGGGGALAPAQCTSLSTPTGASGGSGGSGGCGGDAGGGGQGGGASIALMSYQSSVTLDAVDLVAQTGGKGGNGGKGQSGGSGGGAGSGGNGACKGGAGGKGGRGGHGGGGAGGPSLGIAFSGAQPVRTGGSIQVAATASVGGADGLGNTTGNGAGAPGVVAEELGF